MENRIISTGDKIKEGIYTKHSCFEKVINFSLDNNLVSVCHETIGNGPNNIVVKNPQNVRELTIKHNYISINNILTVRESNNPPVFNSTLTPSGLNIKHITEGIDKITNNYLTFFAPKSLAFLLNINMDSVFTTNFEKAFVATMRNSVTKLVKTKDINEFKNIKGLGFGLTPSGDDFITGFLMGLYINQFIFNKSYTNLAENIFNISTGTNLISNTFIYYAKEGFFYEDFKNFLLKFLYGHDFLKELSEVLLNGHTSGSDVMTGFIYILNKNIF